MCHAILDIFGLLKAVHAFLTVCTHRHNILERIHSKKNGYAWTKKR